MGFKKRVLALVFLLVISFFPIATGATTREFNIPKVEVNATINDDGSVDVVERVTYNFNGDYNGIVRKFNAIYNSNFFLQSVKIIDKNSNEFQAKEAYDASENTYEVNSNSNTEIKLYTKSSNESKIVEIRYQLKNVISKSETEARLNWNFYTVENVSKVDNAILNIKLKGAAFDDNNSKYHIYGDGNITTNYNDGGIRIGIENSTSTLAVDLKFSSVYLPNTPIGNYIEENNNNYNENITAPAERNDEIGGFIVVIIAGVVGLVLFFIVKENNETRKAIGEYRSTEVYNHDDFYHSPPANLPPAIVNLIINEGRNSKSMIFLSLFYLAHRGYYTIENIKINRGWSIDEDLRFTVVKGIDLPQEEHLKFIIEMFRKYDFKGSFTMMEIKDELQKSYKAKAFRESVDLWLAKLEEEGENLSLLITVRNRKVLTNYYNNEREKWILYKKHLQNLMKNEIAAEVLEDSIMLLIYAVALNIDSSKLDKFNSNLIKIKDEKEYNHILNDNYIIYYPIYNQIYSGIEKTVIPNDSFSGGGFDGSSSGGDFGGGGGGGSDAF